MGIQDELVERLVSEDEAFRKAFTVHKEYELKVAAMEKKPHLTTEEALEKKRLKKLKLALKDEMEKIISSHRAEA